jgi:hypothetical protein
MYRDGLAGPVSAIGFGSRAKRRTTVLASGAA